MDESSNVEEISTKALEMAKFSIGRIPADLTIAIMIGIIEAFVAISIVSLIFSGELSEYLNIGISIALLSAMATLIITSILTSVPSGIGTLQDGPNVLLALVAASLAGLNTYSGKEQLLATVLSAMILATFFTAATFLLMGIFRIGSLVRYVPYPVVGGFLAGTGWLLTRGALEMLTGTTLRLANLPQYFDPNLLIQWLPAIAIGVILFVGTRRIQGVWAMPVLLIGVIVAFYILMMLGGVSLEEAANQGLLLGGIRDTTLQFPDPLVLSGANWQAILGQAGNISALIGVSLIALLLNASSLEISMRKDFEINHELRVAGAANLVTSLLGGMVGFLSVSLTSLSFRSGSRWRLAGIAAGVLVGGILFFGFSTLAYFPKAVLGGLLFFLGFDFLFQWVIDAWKRFTLIEYSVIQLILVVIAATDFLVGVGVGLVAMIIMFVVSYSRISVINHSLSGANLQSNVERNAIDRRTLVRKGDNIHILELRGFLFFGTAYSMLELIRARIQDETKLTVRQLLLDFKNVTGLDTSAILSFIKTEQLTSKNGIVLIITGASAEIMDQLQQGGLSGDDKNVHYFPDMDRGLERCEAQLLKSTEDADVTLQDGLYEQLSQLGFKSNLASRLMSYMEPVDLEPGEYLIRQGEPADSLYFIQRGRVSVFLEIPDGDDIRLRTISRGATVGEMGLYSGEARTASVIAEQPTKAHRLLRETLDKIEPELSSEFHRWIGQLLSERLALATRTIEALHPR